MARTGPDNSNKVHRLGKFSAMDILFLHVPKFRNYYKPIGEFSFIHLPPMGLLGLADYARQNGLRTEVVHLGVERHKNGKLDLDRLVLESQPAIVGLDLHWHFQSYDVIEVAREIKRKHPGVSILLGGFTASYFAEEILREFEFIDFVIRGDSEVPIVSLLQHREKGTYEQVPNLAYRKSETVHLNDMTYVADASTLDTICYTDFTLMRDYETFVRSFAKFTDIKGLSQRGQEKLFGMRSIYPVFLGRGCPYRCSYCGGTAEAQMAINQRECLSMRSVASVLSSVRDLDRFGFHTAYIAYDPLPPKKSDEFYLELFEEIGRLQTKLRFEVERWFLPSREFLRSFRANLSPDSCVALSLNSSNEIVRRRNGLHRYSNEEMEASLEMMEEECVTCNLFFSCGLPFETAEDLHAMAAYQRSLTERFKRLRIRNSMIAIEPGSPLSVDPAHYEVRPHRVSFKDYYAYHSEPSHNGVLEMGFDRDGCPSEQEVQRIFCRSFCTHSRTRHLPAFACTALCNSISLLRKAGVYKLINQFLPEES